MSSIDEENVYIADKATCYTPVIGVVWEESLSDESLLKVDDDCTDCLVLEQVSSEVTDTESGTIDIDWTEKSRLAYDKSNFTYFNHKQSFLVKQNFLDPYTDFSTDD